MKIKGFLSQVVSAISILSLVSLLAPQLSIAAALTSSKDTSTRLQISTTANHTITTTMPTAITFDVSGTQDGFQFDFPATFTLGGTWATGDFTFTDSNGAHTVEAVAQGAGTITCTSTTAENVCVAVDTTNNIFTVKPSTSYTASSAASAVTFTIQGTTGDGTLTNPSSVAATTIDFSMCDEQAGCFTTFVATHSSQIAYGIIDDDTVAVTATVNATITFDLDTAAANTCSTTESAAPYSVALGTITNTDTRVSGTTDGVNLLCLDLDTNAGGGAVVTVSNANGSSGLVSTSVPADDIDTADNTAASDNVENYGLCIITTSATTGTLDDEGGYDGDSCTVDTEGNTVQAMSAVTPENMFDTNGAPIAGGRGSIAVNASITIAQPSHADYTDAITFIATGTF